MGYFDERERLSYEQSLNQWAAVNSGSCPTTPQEPTTATLPIHTAVQQLVDFLLSQEWSRADLPTDVTEITSSMWSSADGIWSARIQVTLNMSTTGLPISGAKASPGGQPILNSQVSGGTGSPAPTPVKSKRRADAGQA